MITYHTHQITWSLITHTRSHDHNNSPSPLLLTGWLLLTTVLLVSMVTPNNKQSLLVQYTILLHSVIVWQDIDKMDTINQEIFVYENIYVLNVRVNKFLWVPHEDILTWNVFQLHTIEITVHILPIMTSYLAIATSVLVLQRYLSAITLYTNSILSHSKIQSTVTRPLQHQCHPGIVIGDKNSHQSAQAWVPMPVNVQLRMMNDCTI